MPVILFVPLAAAVTCTGELTVEPDVGEQIFTPTVLILHVAGGGPPTVMLSLFW
jgi:hypothetical protein